MQERYDGRFDSISIRNRQHLQNPVIPHLDAGDEASKLHDVAHTGTTLVLVGLKSLRQSMVGWLGKRVGSESTVW